MSVPRINPVDPPYTTEVQAQFDKIMKGQPPLLLFRTVAKNPRVLQHMIAGGLLDRGSISIRLIMPAGIYHSVSFMINAIGIQNEAFATGFPRKK